MYPRKLNATVTMDDLEKLDTVKVDPLYDALYDAGLSFEARDEVINRLINHKFEEKATTHQAKVLARSNTYLKGSRVSFRDGKSNMTAIGILGNAYQSGNGDVAIEVSGLFYVVAGNASVLVWPKEESRTSATFNNFVSARHIRDCPDQYFNKRISIKFQGTGELISVGYEGRDPHAAFLTLVLGDGETRRYRVPEFDTVIVYSEQQSRRQLPRPNPFGRIGPRSNIPLSQLKTAYVSSNQPDYQGDSWWMYNNRSYLGATIQLGSGDPAKSGVKGVCTQILYEGGKLLFVIDGTIYKRNRHTLVKVWDKKES